MSSAISSIKTGSFGDSFAKGILLMLLVNVGQRVVGLVRNLGFCQFLTDSELGLWALANSFFVIAAPFVVLGLPGSFGKFAEYYRTRGCLRAYLSKVILFSLGSTLLLAIGLFLFQDRVSFLIYGDSLGSSVIIWTALTLLAQVGYNIAFDITISLRQVSVTSRMQFATGTSFAVFGLGCLALGGNWLALLPCYAIACLLGMCVGLWSVYSNCRDQLQTSTTLPGRELWPRVLPFAAALWAANLLANAFESSDRYLLVHLTQGESLGQALVGQYYCGRIVPNLLTSIAMMLGGVLLPYLSADWEAKQPAKIHRRMQQVLSLTSLMFTVISIAALLIVPWLFEVYFQNRYQLATSILGISLVQCIWASVHIVGSSYLFCAERATSHSKNLLAGLCCSVGLSYLLIPQLGLLGAVIATMFANFAVMLLTFRSMNQHGCRVESRTIALCGLPMLLLAGPVPSACIVAGLVFLAGRTQWLLSESDRHELDQLIVPRLKALGLPLQSLWPTCKVRIA